MCESLIYSDTNPLPNIRLAGFVPIQQLPFHLFTASSAAQKLLSLMLSQKLLSLMSSQKLLSLMSSHISIFAFVACFVLVLQIYAVKLPSLG